ncbi:hypothetical protein KY290_031278 [Solanum tuberosum]|uniref:Uncharacterized protein n=1 Tax=Solanum tuberosum TaxID=4113 RepID=A0ABQ7UC52_SOLTU|nr:hypothetical protein KY290_031278 [Solanum tuberosum]
MTNGSIFNPFYNHIQQHSSGKPSKSHLGETNFKQRFECDIGIVLVLRCDVDLEIRRVTEFLKELSAVATGGSGGKNKMVQLHKLEEFKLHAYEN